MKFVYYFLCLIVFSSCDSSDSPDNSNAPAESPPEREILVMLGVGQSNMSAFFEQAALSAIPSGRDFLWDRHSFSGTPIVAWAENNHAGENVNYIAHFVKPLQSMIQQARAKGFVDNQIKIVVFWNQGEADCINGTDQATYRSRLAQIFDRLQIDFNIGGIILCLPDVDESNPNLPAGYTDAKMAPIRLAIQNYANTSSKIVTADLDTSIIPRPADGLHFSSKEVPALGVLLKASWDQIP